MTIKVNFFCTYTFFFVPLHRKQKFADIIKGVYWRLFWLREIRKISHT